MPNLPVRGLGKSGVISDLNPYDLPLGAWSNARNMRFDDTGATRSPVFKTLTLDPTFESPPLYVMDDSLRTTAKSISIVSADGKITNVSDGVISDFTPTVPLSGMIYNITGTIAGSVAYINNPSDAPVAYAHGESRYETIPNWVAGDRCQSFRSYRDFLIALNLTKNGEAYPNMVKWSDAIMAGTRPSWDVAAENGLAGENVLNGSSGFIIDGMELGGSFLIYGSKEVFRMDFIGAPFVFSFEKLFSDLRVMTQNCVVEVDSKHFVFTEDDLIVTDGITKQSICDGKVRKTVFTRIDFAGRHHCRVVHNPIKTEVLFAYPSITSEAAWDVGSHGCNEAAVYNYTTGTWTFIDLPNMTYGSMTTQPTGTTELPQSWDGLVQWNDLKGGWTYAANKPTALMIVSAGTTDKPGRIYFYDDDYDGAMLNPVDEDLYWHAWAEMKLTDFDEIGFPLHASKLVRRVIPQVVSKDPSQGIYMYFRGDMLSTSESVWQSPMVFNPFTDVKIDTRTSGRYFSMRFEVPNGTYARMVGYDIDIMQIAGR